MHLRQETEAIGITDDAISTILDPIKKIFNKEEIPKELFDNGSLERGILSERILPALAELLAGDDSDFKIDVVKTEKIIKKG